MTLRIYLVEDNPLIRENMAATLADLASTSLAGTAETEDHALQWLDTHTDQWDLAIVDLFLKHGNGLGVVAACRARRPHQRVVVLTNYATREIRDQCAKLGADAVFDKSNEIDDLIAFCIAQSRGAAV